MALLDACQMSSFLGWSNKVLHWTGRLLASARRTKSSCECTISLIRCLIWLQQRPHRRTLGLLVTGSQSLRHSCLTWTTSQLLRSRRLHPDCPDNFHLLLPQIPNLPLPTLLLRRNDLEIPITLTLPSPPPPQYPPSPTDLS